jgi:ferredoxin-nitrite reductase
MKFMVDDYGPDGIREEVERRLGRTLPRYELPPPGELSDHVGVHPQRQSGMSYVGVPVHLGLVTGERLIAVSDLADDLGGDVRVTRQQNFVLTNVPDARSTRPCAARRDRLPAGRQPRALRRRSPAPASHTATSR